MKQNFYLLLIICGIIFTNCQSDYRESTWHRINISNRSTVRLLIEYQTINDTLNLILEPIKNGKPIAQKTTIFDERVASEERQLAYNQADFDNRLRSIRIFRHENDSALTEIFAIKPFTDLTIWDVRFFRADEMDNYDYWLNITDEIAKN